MQKDKRFALYIWNNNPIKKNELYKNIKEATPNFSVYCYNSKDNVGGIGRFYMVRKMTFCLTETPESFLPKQSDKTIQRQERQ